MNQERNSIRFRAVPSLGLAALLGAGLVPASAQASDSVYWSIGVAPAPGVTVIAGNAPPPRVVAAPVYVAPPVYALPPVVYTLPRVVYGVTPVYVQPAVPPGHWQHPGRGWGHGKGKGHGHGHWHGKGHGDHYRY